jgi:hypothetical protein
MSQNLITLIACTVAFVLLMWGSFLVYVLCDIVKSRKEFEKRRREGEESIERGVRAKRL